MNYAEFQKRFKNMSDEELITAFNREVGNTGWTGARASYLAYLHGEFINRGFDYSAIGNQDSLSFKNKIRLVDKKIIIDSSK